jgi:CRISPR-associated protein Csh1
LKDFDFVSKFRFSLKNNEGQLPEIKNIFKLKEKGEIKRNYFLKNIFQFEADIVKKIFNNSLVRLKEESYNVNYFGDMKPEYVSGGDLVYQIILKYRKAFYDYIYKSKTEAINSYMWDEILWNSILSDLRSDRITEKGYHSKENSIKEKLNFWFSLYNYFTNNQKRGDMASKIPELLNKARQVVNNDGIHFQTTEEFAFGAGQMIYYLLNQSRASERTHALLEPFLQKVKIDQLQNAISQAVNAYKHEISFGKGRFERLSAEVLGYYTEENLKKYQKYLLSGYFAPAVIYEKKENNEN